MAYVKFLSVKLQETYDALITKDANSLYFVQETNRIYRGDLLMGTGALATEQAAGLLSAEDYVRLQTLVASSGISNLTAVDGTISIADTADGGKTIGVAIAPDATNALTAVDGGLFVPTVVVPEYTIEKQTTAEDGFAASYKLKKTVGEEVSYVGDTINIAKDLVLQSATLETATEADVPYAGAVVGDPYIKMVFNNEEASNLYVPVKDLVDTYTAGDGISIENGVVSVKIAEDSHGLHFVDGSMAMLLATTTSDGAMSKEDKKILDAIPSVYVSRKYDISGTPEGTLVNYGEKEIRVMCPADVGFAKQNVGVGGDANTCYMTFKTYAPNESVVGYIEHLNGQTDSEILTTFSVDEYGRRYQPTWLALAKYDDSTGAWTYYGANSSNDRMIGFDYRIDWFDANNVMIASDSIRINLSNESCHNNIEPYYMVNYATAEEVATIKESVDSMSESYIWAEM